MKKLLLLLFSVFIALSCTKQNPTPDGPSDIRIKNITASDFTDVFVDIGDGENEGEYSYGDLANHSETEYHRFEIAYPKALISLKIGDVTYSTATPDHTYSVPLQQGKFTYEVWVSTGTTLEMRVIADAPLDDLK
ncbi:MAG: hypothetical protein V2I37_04430 [Marinilabiliaceae bacterium]|jgi:hypothetical protein|nr:hypothetical protein [Marinilabiliaceae bacterium]